jgi:hypothetical protein
VGSAKTEAWLVDFYGLLSRMDFRLPRIEIERIRGFSYFIVYIGWVITLVPDDSSPIVFIGDQFFLALDF